METGRLALDLLRYWLEETPGCVEGGAAKGEVKLSLVEVYMELLGFMLFHFILQLVIFKFRSGAKTFSTLL